MPLRRQVIVREKLVFPSGTATAQMISVLHSAPAPASTSALRHRRPSSSARSAGSGYEAVPDRDRDEDEDEVEEETVKQGKGEFDQTGWVALSWSFGVSAIFTVRSSPLSSDFDSAT